MYLLCVCALYCLFVCFLTSTKCVGYSHRFNPNCFPSRTALSLKLYTTSTQCTCVYVCVLAAPAERATTGYHYRCYFFHQRRNCSLHCALCECVCVCVLSLRPSPVLHMPQAGQPQPKRGSICSKHKASVKDMQPPG